MTQQHPDLAAEQDFIEYAYRCLEISRDAAWRMRNLHEGTLGGTFQARYERDVFDEVVVNRLTQLDLGNAASHEGAAHAHYRMADFYLDRATGDVANDD